MARNNPAHEILYEIVRTIELAKLSPDHTKKFLLMVAAHEENNADRLQEIAVQIVKDPQDSPVTAAFLTYILSLYGITALEVQKDEDIS